MNDRSERNWHTAEPRREPRRSEESAGAKSAGDGAFADGADIDDAPGHDGYAAEGGFAQRTFDASMRPGARGNRAERFTGEGEEQDRDTWSRAQPRGAGNSESHELQRRDPPGGERGPWGQSRRHGGAAGNAGWGGQARTTESYGHEPGGSAGSSGRGAQPSAGFGRGGSPAGYGEWGGVEKGPFRAQRGRGGEGSQWGSPSASRQGSNESRDDWYRDHSMRGGEPWTVPGPYTGRGPQGYERSDRAILEDVCERLTRHGEVDATNIVVRCEGREVILEGTVEDRRAKRLAEDTAESVSGVRDVQNRLRIRDVSDEMRGVHQESNDDGGAESEPGKARGPQ